MYNVTSTDVNFISEKFDIMYTVVDTYRVFCLTENGRISHEELKSSKKYLTKS